MGMVMGVSFQYSMGIGMGMGIGIGVIFKNRYGCGYSSTHPDVIPKLARMVGWVVFLC